MKVNHFLSKNVFWENAVGYLRNGECESFQTFAIVFSTPEKLLVGISGALGRKVSHFLSKNVFWENAVGHLRNGECESFQTFTIVFSQNRFICQVLCSGMQVISALVLGGTSAKIGSSAKFCVVVCKSSLLWYWGGPSAKEGSSAKFCVVVCKSSLLWYWGVIGQRRFCVGLSFCCILDSGTDSLIQNMFWLPKTSFQALWALHQVCGQPNNNALVLVAMLTWACLLAIGAVVKH